MHQPRPHHRPAFPGSALFESIEGGADPAVIREAAAQCAEALVRGSSGDDPQLVQRMVRLADDEGLEALAELWAPAPPDSVAGALWRLYLLRSFVHAAPQQAAAEFDAGQRFAGSALAVAGVVDPPGPDEVRAMLDQVLAGVATADFADALFRAAAFARVVAIGRSHLPDIELRHAARLATMADQLEHAGHLELAGHLP